jgi:hypothetical protein
MDSTEPGQALDALPAGCLFADWIARRGCAKSTAYRMRSELGIEPERRRVGARVEVWLSAAQEALLDAYAEALGRGLSTADALVSLGLAAASPMESIELAGALAESDGRVSLVPVESIELPAHDPVDSDGDLRRLRQRLAALRDALELGAPLSTAEAALLLGARPGGDVVTRGRLRAVREGRNLWTLEPD